MRTQQDREAFLQQLRQHREPAKRPAPATYRNAERPVLKAYLKECCGCDRVKDRDEFYNRKAAPDGKLPRCKSCMKGGTA